MHGVVVKVNRPEVQSWGLPEGTKAVLLFRGRHSGSVTWRCLDAEAFKSLRPEEDRYLSWAMVDQLPVGVAAYDDREADRAVKDDGE